MIQWYETKKGLWILIPLFLIFTFIIFGTFGFNLGNNEVNIACKDGCLAHARISWFENSTNYDTYYNNSYSECLNFCEEYYNISLS